MVGAGAGCECYCGKSHISHRTNGCSCRCACAALPRCPLTPGLTAGPRQHWTVPRADRPGVLQHHCAASKLLTTATRSPCQTSATLARWVGIPTQPPRPPPASLPAGTAQTGSEPTCSWAGATWKPGLAGGKSRQGLRLHRGFFALWFSQGEKEDVVK